MRCLGAAIRPAVYMRQAVKTPPMAWVAPRVPSWPTSNMMSMAGAVTMYPWAKPFSRANSSIRHQSGWNWKNTKRVCWELRNVPRSRMTGSKNRQAENHHRNDVVSAIGNPSQPAIQSSAADKPADECGNRQPRPGWQRSSPRRSSSSGCCRWLRSAPGIRGLPRRGPWPAPS